eukprot:2003244-Amphidinium_carterae.1
MAEPDGLTSAHSSGPRPPPGPPLGPGQSLIPAPPSYPPPGRGHRPPPLAAKIRGRKPLKQKL